MVASDGFAEFLREQFAPLGRVTMRRMFGKTGVFCDGLMFGMVTDNLLYLRVDDENRAALKEAESDPPLSYEKQDRTIDLSFWRAPEQLLVRQRAKAVLQIETRQVQLPGHLHDLRGDGLRRADEQGAVWPGRALVLLARHRAPAALLSDAGLHGSVVWPGLVEGLLVG